MTGVSLVVIARDEERCIARALHSAAPFVDEMVVVDTGSVDATPTIATGCGARVEHVPWRDDFSAARNAALAVARFPWRLALDADEWIYEGGALLRLWCATHDGSLGAIEVRSRLDAGGGPDNVVAVDNIARVLPVGVRFVGRIHEQPDRRGPLLPTGVAVMHDGYLQDQRLRKQGRNEALLRAELAARHDPYLVFQLAKDLEVQGRASAAVAEYRRAVAETPLEAGWRHALVSRALQAFIAGGAHDEALHLFSTLR